MNLIKTPPSRQKIIPHLYSWLNSIFTKGAPWKGVTILVLLGLPMSFLVVFADLSTGLLYAGLIPIAMSAFFHPRRIVYLSTSAVIITATIWAVMIVSSDTAESLKTIIISSVCLLSLCEIIHSLTAARNRAIDSEREASATLQATLDAIPDIIGIQGLDHEIFSYNKAGYEYLKATPEFVSGKKCYELIDKGMPCDVCATKIALKTKRPAKIEKFEPTMNTWLDVRTYPVLDKNGNVVRLIEHLRDITDIKRAEETIRESERFLQDVFDAIRDGICVFDKDLHVLRVNSWMEDLFTDQLPLVGKNCHEVFNCADPDLQACPNQRALTSDTAETEVVEFVLPSVGSIWLELTAYALKSTEGETVGVITYLKDISTKVQAESEKTELQEQLLQSQKMEAIGRLAGGIAHDFNNMLTAIKGNAELLISSLNDLEGNNTSVPADFRTYMDEVVAASDRAQALTTQLLTFSRKHVMQEEAVNLDELLTKIKPMLRRIIGEDINISTLISTPKCFVFADSAQIEQIILNLAVNARDAMPDGGQITFEVTDVHDGSQREQATTDSPTMFLFSVSDTGTGLTDETKKHLFEPFFTTKEVGKSTGLGLATVYAIVDQLGGSIMVDSEIGKGTTFRIFLPCAVEFKEPESQSSTIPAVDNRGHEKILLVEDEQIVSDLIVRILTRRGYQILSAKSPANAIQILKNQPSGIDMLVSDVVMPGMNGVELAEELKRTQPDLRVLFISGYAHDTIGSLTSNENGVNFIQKPFAPDALTAKVRGILDES
ncbi:MAG: response regulator [Spirochaetales bacterium]|nr:response regulator [Spirochaetales bacterium]